MSVFERTREIGILSAIGMKGRQIIALFLTEATLLGASGIAFGSLIGWALSAYFGKVGVYFGDLGISGEMLLQDRIYTDLTLEFAVKSDRHSIHYHHTCFTLSGAAGFPHGTCRSLAQSTIKEKYHGSRKISRCHSRL